jgi:hypothetical protein
VSAASIINLLAISFLMANAFLIASLVAIILADSLFSLFSSTLTDLWRKSMPSSFKICLLLGDPEARYIDLLLMCYSK